MQADVAQQKAAEDGSEEHHRGARRDIEGKAGGVTAWPGDVTEQRAPDRVLGRPGHPAEKGGDRDVPQLEASRRGEPAHDDREDAHER